MANPTPIQQAQDRYALHWFEVQTELNHIKLQNARRKQALRIIIALTGGLVFLLGLGVIFGYLTSVSDIGKIDSNLVGIIGTTAGSVIIGVSYGILPGSGDDQKGDVPPIKSAETNGDGDNGDD